MFEGGIDVLKKLIAAREKILRPKVAKKMLVDNLKTIAKYPLVDLNWLNALAKHYKIAEDEKWIEFKAKSIKSIN